MDCPKIAQQSYRSFSEQLHGKVASARMPLDGTIELTMRCNLKCTHCYCVRDNEKKELTATQWKEIIDQITDAGCLWLLITGGEPLLRPDFLEIYLYAKRKGLIVSLFTNGTILNEEMAMALAESPPFVIEITLYGASNETYKKVCGMDNAFDSTIRGIELIKKYNLPLKLKSTITKRNFHELETIKEIAVSYSVEFRFDGIIFPRINGETIPINERIDARTLASLEISTSHDLWEKAFYELKIDIDENSSALQCKAGSSTFQIDPYGDLYMCKMLNSYSYNLTQGKFVDGWDKFSHLLASFEKINNKCIGCNSFTVCDICPGLVYLENKNYTDIPEFLCKLAGERKDFIMLNDGGGCKWRVRKNTKSLK